MSKVEPIKWVELVSRRTVPMPTLIHVFMALDKLTSEGKVIALYELRQLCDNPEHKIFGTNGHTLHGSGLLAAWDPGRNVAIVHEHVRDIILVSVWLTGHGVRVAKKPQDVIRRSL